MIRYALVCRAEHSFESWFRDSDAFVSQSKAGLVSCPVCGATDVRKSIMAPALAKPTEVLGAAPQPDAVRDHQVALVSDKERELSAMLRAVRRYIETNSDDVGHRFPDEARAIQAGLAEKRAIRGEAALDEVAALIDEGIDIMPLPPLPEDRN